MKKIVITFAFVLGTLALQAQDTVYSAQPLDRYYFDYNWWNEYDTVVGVYWGGIQSSCDEATLAKMLTTKDSLKVYGLAASVRPIAYSDPDCGSLDTVPDEVLEQVFVYMRLYGCGPERPFGLPYQIGPDLILQYAHPSYYFQLTKPERVVGPKEFCPVYEQYFDQPITVTDTFFVGVTVNPSLFYPDCLGRNMFQMSINDCVRTDEIYQIRGGGEATFMRVRVDSCGWKREYKSRDTDFFLYPIITPNPADTNGGGGPGEGDTTAIRPADAVGQLVSVRPNPAKEEVRLSARFAISRVQIADAAGHTVYEGKAAGNEHTVDIRDWPAGAYIVHVYTSTGLATTRFIKN